MTLREALVRGGKDEPSISETELVMRMLRITSEIVRVVRLFRIRHVGLEGVPRDAVGVYQLGEVAGIVKSQLWMKFKIVPRIVSPASARKHVIGYGGDVPTGLTEVVRDGLGVPVENKQEAASTIVARYTFDTIVAEEKEL